MSTYKRNIFSGFTLIELLVVIAVIAIVAAMLFPVFAKAREKARQITCVSNLRQLTQAITLYSEDYDEDLPYWSYFYSSQGGSKTPNHLESLWFNAIYPYVKNSKVFNCPDAGDSRSLRQTIVGSWADPVAFNTSGVVSPLMDQSVDYGYNELMSVGLMCHVDGPCNIGATANPSLTLLLADCDLPLTGESTLAPSDANPSDPVHGYTITRCAFPNVRYEFIPPDAPLSSFGGLQRAILNNGIRHTEGSNIAYVDGHVKFRHSDNITLDLLIGYGTGS